MISSNPACDTEGPSSERREHASKVVYPSVAQVRTLRW